jgi:hypothetical protein
VFFVPLSPAVGLDQGAEVAYRPGGHARGHGRPWRGIGWELRDVAGREVRQVRAAERRLRQNIRRGVEAGQGVKLPSDIQRKIPDNPELQGIRGTRPAGLFEDAGGQGSGGYRI